MTSVERYEHALRLLDAYIRENNLRHTLERENLLRMMAELNKPVFTFKDLDKKRQEAHISVPTLYNSLNLFVSARILYCMPRTQGVSQEQYKWTFESKNTLRMICTRCGREAAFRDKALEQIVQKRNYTNFVPANYALFVYGECKICRKLQMQRIVEEKNILRPRSSIE